MKTTRTCEICGVEHGQLNSPVCGPCRRKGSKKPCPIEGCGRMIDGRANTCLFHRHLQSHPNFDCCQECGVAFDAPVRTPICSKCRAETFVLCACGCGRFRRKYNNCGQELKYISGHDDNWKNSRREEAACLVCGKRFRGRKRQKLCSTECRSKWADINKPREAKVTTTKCAVCGTDVLRPVSEIQGGRDAVCSDRCRYILVANKLRGPRSDGKRLALQRDRGACRICGFDVIVHVHHIDPKRNGGAGGIDNLITLCPNHHAMADRGLMDADSLQKRLE
jgi:hypothetical protein